MTMRDIAKACNVSVATVSNVINGKSGVSDKTRERIKAFIEKENYTPNAIAKHLKTKETKTIGVILEDITIFSIPSVVDGITEYCEGQGYRLMVSNLRLYGKYFDTYYSKEEYFLSLVRETLRDMYAAQVDGIIYVSAHERVLTCLPEEFPIPLVMSYAYSQTNGIPSIVIDDEDGAQQLVEYLLHLGHRKIGVITGKEGSAHANKRLIGYQRALFQNQILYDPRLVLQGDWTAETGFCQAEVLLDRGVTAIFCMNDLMAEGAVRKANQRHLTVPGDISIVGYDDREWADMMTPALTTVRLPLHEIGFRAAQCIIQMIGQGDQPTEQPVNLVPCELVIRSSAGRVQEKEKQNAGFEFQI